jgi:hypothetical protein
MMSWPGCCAPGTGSRPTWPPASSPADDPRVEPTAQAIVAAIPEPARQAIQFPDGGFAETDQGFAAAFYADFAPAQAAAISRAVDLMSQARRS